MARRPDLLEMSARFGITYVTIEDLREYLHGAPAWANAHAPFPSNDRHAMAASDAG